MPIQRERLLADLDRLAGFGADPGGGVTRIAFSEAERAAADWLRRRMREAGLVARIDAAGNVIGRLGPEDWPAVVCGSHIDSVPNGGRLDGALGVLAGLEAARGVAERGLPGGTALEIVAFSDEEGAHLSLLGARAFVGDPTLAADIAAARGRDGRPLAETLRGAGLDPDRLDVAARKPGEIAAYLELHIEQGPVLEHLNVPIGIVDSIVGVRTGAFVFEGAAAHAGTTPFALRRDALRAAAETIAEALDTAETDGGGDLRLTYGRLEIAPGAANVVPARVRLTEEIRAGSDAAIEATHRRTLAIAEAAGARHGVMPSYRQIGADPPAAMAPRVIAAIEAACADLGVASHRTPSGAGHDAQMLATLCDAGMIFVPSRGGVSHTPDEATDPDDIALGAEVLSATLARLLAAPS